LAVRFDPEAFGLTPGSTIKPHIDHDLAPEHGRLDHASFGAHGPSNPDILPAAFFLYC
jgi:hypothetical protein